MERVDRDHQAAYYAGERGNKPYELEAMLRIHVLQELYDLADMAVMNEVIDSRAFSEFCGVDSSNQVPDGDTIGRFRALLVKHGLQKRLFAQVVSLLENKGLILKKGTIVDSTIIAAPSSTKNRARKRDPPTRPRRATPGISATRRISVWTKPAGWCIMWTRLPRMCMM